MQTIKLGVLAKDKITGFEGIITAKIEYLTGCDQYCLSPKIDKDGKIPEGAYFDGARLEFVSSGIMPEEVQSNKEKGGPNRDAPKN